MSYLGKLGWLCRLSLVATLLVFLPLSSNAQTANTSVRGNVTDATGAVIPNVDVTISENSIGFTQTHQTDEKGGYSFQQIPPGTYLIKVIAEFDSRTKSFLISP